MEAGVGLPLHRRGPVVAAPGQAHAQHADAAVSEPDQMVGDRLGGLPIVGADPVQIVQPRLVADHHRHRAFEHRGQVRIVLGDRVDDESVHPGAVHRGDVLAFGTRRDQQQALTGILAGQRETFEETYGARITEGVREVLGEQQSDCARLPGSQ